MLNIEEVAAAKLKAEEDAAKEKLDCFLVAGLLYFSASDLLRMGMGTAALIGGSSAVPRHLQTHFGATRAFGTS